MLKLARLAPLLGLALAACADHGSTPTGPYSIPQVIPPPGPPPVTVEGVPVQIMARMSRADGKPLMVFFRLTSSNGAPLPAGLDMREATVLFQGERWVAAPEEAPSRDPAVLEATSLDGPLWGPDVTVAFGVTLALEGRDVAQIASQSLIERSD